MLKDLIVMWLLFGNTSAVLVLVHAALYQTWQKDYYDYSNFETVIAFYYGLHLLPLQVADLYIKDYPFQPNRLKLWLEPHPQLTMFVAWAALIISWPLALFLSSWTLFFLGCAWVRRSLSLNHA